MPCRSRVDSRECKYNGPAAICTVPALSIHESHAPRACSCRRTGRRGARARRGPDQLLQQRRQLLRYAACAHPRLQCAASTAVPVDLTVFTEPIVTNLPFEGITDIPERRRRPTRGQGEPRRRHVDDLRPDHADHRRCVVHVHRFRHDRGAAGAALVDQVVQDQSAGGGDVPASHRQCRDHERHVRRLRHATRRARSPTCRRASAASRTARRRRSRRSTPPRCRSAFTLPGSKTGHLRRGPDQVQRANRLSARRVHARQQHARQRRAARHRYRRDELASSTA